MRIQISLSKMDSKSFWEQLGLEGQKVYLAEHPKSKKKITAVKDTSSKDTSKIDILAYAKSRDDAEVSVDKILSKFTDAERKEMAEVEKNAMTAVPSDKLYTDKDGVYTKARLKLHAKIIKHILSAEQIKRATPEAGAKPSFVVLGGRGGSGKSSFTHSEDGKAPTVNEFDSRKYLTLDADAIKGMLKPPYNGGNANQVHEESSMLFEQISAIAQAQKLNIISDATLKSDKMGPQLKAMKEQGYDIEGHYMFLPRQKAAARACGRYLGKGPDARGRYVPPAVILGNTKNEENFDKLKEHFSKWSFYDNDQERGQPPKLISHS